MIVAGCIRNNFHLVCSNSGCNMSPRSCHNYQVLVNPTFAIEAGALRSIPRGALKLHTLVQFTADNQNLLFTAQLITNRHQYFPLSQHSFSPTTTAVNSLMQLFIAGCSRSSTRRCTRETRGVCSRASPQRK